MLATAVPDGDAFIVTVQGRVAMRLDTTALAELELRDHPRWIFDSTADDYPPLLRAGIRVRHSYDVTLAERILLAREGRFGEPVRAAAVLARAAGAEVPHDPDPAAPGGVREVSQPRLFGAETETSERGASSPDLFAAHRDQADRLEITAGGGQAGIDVPLGALKLLLAAESGSALVAAEMTARGLPWDAEAHRQILAEQLGPRPPEGQRPERLASLAERIAEAFGFAVNPDSPLEVKEAFRRHGVEIESTRAWVLHGVEHPAVGPLLEYKDLARLWTANGWHWIDEWISADGRLAAQFLPGAVVSGRWATRGGGGLQLPAVIRAAAVAKPGYALVVADAAQLEPRILAALSRDPGLTDLARGDDLYTALATDGFGGDRRAAKLALLGAMYGQTSGEAARLMAALRVRYPEAVGYVEAAARRGERGAVVRSVLGRACPPPSDGWWRVVGAGDTAEAGDGFDAAGGIGGAGGGAAAGSGSRQARRVARDRGRFTRNFVIQASAADWASVWMTTLRLALLDRFPGAEMVLFQHDELVVHVPESQAHEVGILLVDAARRARDLVFPGSTVALPVRPTVVASYADAK